MPGTSSGLGGMAPIAAKAECLIVVDHHAQGSEGFGHLSIIDPQAAASAELAYLLIQAAGWAIDERIAPSLLTGPRDRYRKVPVFQHHPGHPPPGSRPRGRGGPARSDWPACLRRNSLRLSGRGRKGDGKRLPDTGSWPGLVGHVYRRPEGGRHRTGRHRSSDRPGPPAGRGRRGVACSRSTARASSREASARGEWPMWGRWRRRSAAGAIATRPVSRFMVRPEEAVEAVRALLTR